MLTLSRSATTPATPSGWPGKRRWHSAVRSYWPSTPAPLVSLMISSAAEAASPKAVRRSRRCWVCRCANGSSPVGPAPAAPAAGRGGGHPLVDRAAGRRAPRQRGDRGRHRRPGDAGQTRPRPTVASRGRPAGSHSWSAPGPAGRRPVRRAACPAPDIHGWFPAAERLGGGEFAEELVHVLMIQVQHDAPRPVVLAQDEGRVQADGVTARLVAHPQIP